VLYEQKKIPYFLDFLSFFGFSDSAGVDDGAGAAARGADF